LALLQERREILDTSSRLLLEHETLGEEELREICCRAESENELSRQRCDHRRVCCTVGILLSDDGRIAAPSVIPSVLCTSAQRSAYSRTSFLTPSPPFSLTN
jgi:hypothetical protein